PAHFPTTRWSLVLQAGDPHAALARESLAELCGSYWYPLYAYVRRRGYDPEQARDLTQDFFARALEKGLLAEADPSRGRFRSFLRTVCAHFLANRHDWERARKRGGGQIGRASCRERVERAGVGVAVEEKSEVDQRGRSW